MTLAGLWRDRHAAKPAIKRKGRGAWTDLCQCGHPLINHTEIDLQNGKTYPAPCPCGCASFRRAKRTKKTRTPMEKRARQKARRRANRR